MKKIMVIILFIILFIPAMSKAITINTSIPDKARYTSYYNGISFYDDTKEYETKIAMANTKKDLFYDAVLQKPKQATKHVHKIVTSFKSVKNELYLYKIKQIKKNKVFKFNSNPTHSTQKVIWAKERETRVTSTNIKPKITKCKYTIKYGDTLAKIAKAKHITVEQIMSWNSYITNKNLIFPGKKLVLHLKNSRKTEKKKYRSLIIHSHVKNKSNKSKMISHIERTGETLSQIAQMYNTGINEMLRNNDISNKNFIFSRMKLKIYRSKRPGINIDMSHSMSLKDKISIFKKVGKETGVDWKILYGLCKKESGLGVYMIGDNGKSLGWFQIHTGYHPEVTYKLAMDLEKASRYAAEFLIKLGYFENKFNALRKYNGSLDNPITAKRAKKVLDYANDIRA